MEKFVVKHLISYQKGTSDKVWGYVAIGRGGYVFWGKREKGRFQTQACDGFDADNRASLKRNEGYRNCPQHDIPDFQNRMQDAVFLKAILA